MIQIRISYTRPEDKKKVLELLKELCIIKVRNTKSNGKYAKIYIEAE